MTTPIIERIDADIAQLSLAEQLWLMERLAHRIRTRTLQTQIAQERALVEMAHDPTIQGELQQINAEFVVTEADGLDAHHDHSTRWDLFRPFESHSRTRPIWSTPCAHAVDRCHQPAPFGRYGRRRDKRRKHPTGLSDQCMSRAHGQWPIDGDRLPLFPDTLLGSETLSADSRGKTQRARLRAGRTGRSVLSWPVRTLLLTQRYTPETDESGRDERAWHLVRRRLELAVIVSGDP